MELDEFKVEILADKEKAKELYAMLLKEEVEELELPSLPAENISDFLGGSRENVWEITINGNSFLEVVPETREAAVALLEMIKSAEQEEFPLAPLPVKNLKDFIDGKRSNVALLEIHKNKNVKVKAQGK